MSAARSRSRARPARILRQLRHDRRTVALLVVVPALLLALLYFMYDGAGADLRPDRAGHARASSRS